jgi:hypothetical protein
MSKKNKNQIEVFSSNTPANRPASPFFGLIFIGAGMFPLLLGLGVIHVPASSVHAPLFIVTAVGAAFIAGGLAATLQGLGVSQNAFIMKILGLCLVCSMLTPFGWVVLGNSGADLFVRIIFGLLVGFFALIFLIATIASFAPNFAARFGFKVIDNTNGERPRISKQRKL